MPEIMCEFDKLDILREETIRFDVKLLSKDLKSYLPKDFQDKVKTNNFYFHKDKGLVIEIDSLDEKNEKISKKPLKKDLKSWISNTKYNQELLLKEENKEVMIVEADEAYVEMKQLSNLTQVFHRCENGYYHSVRQLLKETSVSCC